MAAEDNLVAVAGEHSSVVELETAEGIPVAAFEVAGWELEVEAVDRYDLGLVVQHNAKVLRQLQGKN